MKLRNMFSPVTDPGEINLEPSMTEPDMALTPQQILERFTAGRPLPQSENLFYSGDEYLPDFRTLDISEISDIIADTDMQIKELQQQVKDAKKAKKDKEKQQKKLLPAPPAQGDDSDERSAAE